MDRKPHARALRKGRYSEPGRAYIVTTVTRERRPVFAQLTAARCLVSAMRREHALGRAQTLAYVVMPDHLHWLLVLRQDAALASVVGTVKSVTAHRLGGTVWQHGFYDHALRQEEGLLPVARYIIANPVRAGLVKRVGDYPHWDAVWL